MAWVFIMRSVGAGPLCAVLKSERVMGGIGRSSERREERRRKIFQKKKEAFEKGTVKKGISRELYMQEGEEKVYQRLHQMRVKDINRFEQG